MVQSDKVSKAFRDLSMHRASLAPFDMRKAFARRGDRFAEFSATQEDLLLDYSKCAVTAKSVKLLLALARAAGVAAKRDAMFAYRAGAFPPITFNLFFLANSIMGL